ncbi:MAG: CvpA family protein [Candidatus Aminicenantes bacterium]|nr:CvpA family protein [Candidatus Aminicenantes bacterium]MCK5068338.1 CvpA family protein [Bacteroidales bacterium]
MIAGFNILDILFVTIVLLSVIFGILKGFIRELFSLAFFIIALILSFLYYSDVGKIYGDYVGKNIADFAGFVSILVFVLVVGTLVTYFIKKAFILGPLKSIDRIFGAVFGLLRGVLIAAIIMFAMVAFQINDRLVEESKLSPYVLETIQAITKLTPDKFKEKKDELIERAAPGTGKKDSKKTAGKKEGG